MICCCGKWQNNFALSVKTKSWCTKASESNGFFQLKSFQFLHKFARVQICGLYSFNLFSVEPFYLWMRAKSWFLLLGCLINFWSFAPDGLVWMPEHRTFVAKTWKVSFGLFCKDLHLCLLTYIYISIKTFPGARHIVDLIFIRVVILRPKATWVDNTLVDSGVWGDVQCCFVQTVLFWNFCFWSLFRRYLSERKLQETNKKYQWMAASNSSLCLCTLTLLLIQVTGISAFPAGFYENYDDVAANENLVSNTEIKILRDIEDKLEDIQVNFSSIACNFFESPLFTFFSLQLSKRLFHSSCVPFHYKRRSLNKRLGCFKLASPSSSVTIHCLKWCLKQSFCQQPLYSVPCCSPKLLSCKKSSRQAEKTLLMKTIFCPALGDNPLSFFKMYLRAIKPISCSQLQLQFSVRQIRPSIRCKVSLGLCLVTVVTDVTCLVYVFSSGKARCVRSEVTRQSRCAYRRNRAQTLSGCVLQWQESQEVLGHFRYARPWRWHRRWHNPERPTVRTDKALQLPSQQKRHTRSVLIFCTKKGFPMFWFQKSFSLHWSSFLPRNHA